MCIDVYMYISMPISRESRYNICLSGIMGNIINSDKTNPKKSYALQ